MFETESEDDFNEQLMIGKWNSESWIEFRGFIGVKLKTRKNFDNDSYVSNDFDTVLIINWGFRW